MKDNIVDIAPARNPDNVLKGAIGEYSEVLIIGLDKEDYLDPRASLGLSKADMLWLIERFKSKLVNGDYDLD